MKRKIDENGETEAPSPPKAPQNYMVPQNFAVRPAVPMGWQPWPNPRFRGIRGPWRGPRGVPNNHGYFRAPGRGRPFVYYDPNQQMYQPNYYQNAKWNQPPPPPPPPMVYPPQQTSTGEVQHQDGSTVQQHQQQQQQQSQQQPQHQQQKEENFKKPKSRRRPMSQSYPSRPWNKQDAERALKEEAIHMKGLRNKSLIIRFPDPEVSKDMVKAFHQAIDKVHFQVPSGARYCFVQLHEKANTEKTIKDLEQINFGSGKLAVEKKFQKDEEDLTPESIDPYTLYIGNLPTNVNVACVKEKFPTATRIDIGYAQKMKHTRYAFIRYNSVDEAIKAYRNSHNLVLESRSIIVRFRRQRGQIGLPGENGNQKQQPKSAKAKVKKEKEKEKDAKQENVPIKKEEEKDDDDDDDDDDEEEDDDDEEEEEEEEDDEDDDDDDDDDDDVDDDDDDEDEEDEADGQQDTGNPDDPDDPDDFDDDMDDDDDDDDDDNDDDDNDFSGGLFQQIDSRIDNL